MKHPFAEKHIGKVVEISIRDLDDDGKPEGPVERITGVLELFATSDDGILFKISGEKYVYRFEDTEISLWEYRP